MPLHPISKLLAAAYSNSVNRHSICNWLLSIWCHLRFEWCHRVCASGACIGISTRIIASKRVYVYAHAIYINIACAYMLSEYMYTAILLLMVSSAFDLNSQQQLNTLARWHVLLLLDAAHYCNKRGSFSHWLQFYCCCTWCVRCAWCVRKLPRSEMSMKKASC
jgi:hypothetical protein